MNIALLTEETDAPNLAGVAAWCGQLISGLPEHSFDFIALKTMGIKPMGVSTSKNLTAIRASVKHRSQKSHVPDVLQEKFDQSHALFMHALMHPEQGNTEFCDALKGFYDYALKANLEAAFRSNASLERVIQVWSDVQIERIQSANTHFRDVNIQITIDQALLISNLIAQYLQPLSHPVPKTDLIHVASNGLSVLTALIAKWVFGTPFVLTEHDMYLRECHFEQISSKLSYPVRVLKLRFYQLLCASAYVFADKIVSSSVCNQRWLLHSGVTEGKLRVVHTGIDLTRFNESLNAPSKPTISWSGSIEPSQDLETLIRAFALVRLEIPSAKLRIFGTVSAGNELYFQICQALIDELRLEGSACFEEQTNDAQAAYHAGHVFLMTSIAADFSRTLIEAMACGCAIISTNVNAAAETINEAGLLVVPRDATAIASACLTLLRDDTALRRRLGQIGRTRAVKHFSNEKCFDDYRKIYDEIVTNKNPTIESRVSRSTQFIVARKNG